MSQDRLFQGRLSYLVHIGLALTAVTLLLAGRERFQDAPPPDMYQEEIAFRAAREPIVVLQAFGAAWINSVLDANQALPLGDEFLLDKWVDLGPICTALSPSFPRPPGAEGLQRLINVRREGGGDSPGHLIVEVRVRARSVAGQAVSGAGDFMLSAVIPEVSP